MPALCRDRYGFERLLPPVFINHPLCIARRLLPQSLMLRSHFKSLVRATPTAAQAMTAPLSSEWISAGRWWTKPLLFSDPPLENQSPVLMIPASRGVRERIEFGRGQRRKLRRSDHAHWDAKQRKNDPIEIILAVNQQSILDLV